jgi:hypothetical protein
MRRRLPRTIWLDEKVAIRVKYDSPAMLAAIYGSPGKAGCYDHAAKTIHIDRTISYARKWRTLRHELIHSLIDVDADCEGGY